MPVVVNSETIEDEIVHQERSHLRHRFAHLYETRDSHEVEEWIKNLAHHNVVSRTLLQQEAWRDAEPIPPEAITRQLEEWRKSDQNLGNTEADRHNAEGQLRLSRLVAQVTRAIPRPTRKEIDLHYKTNRSRFIAPERIHVRQIVKNLDESTTREAVLAAMRQAQMELELGASFTDIAERHSDCAGTGGDLGWFAAGTMVEEFDQVVFGMQPGETSPIFETRFGLHIAQVIERRPEGPQPLSEIRDRLAEGLYEERRSKAISRFVDELTARSTIQIEREQKAP